MIASLISKFYKQRDPIAAALKRSSQPGWAMDLPEDPTTYHLGDSEKARQFQESFSQVRQSDGWSASHRCIMEILSRFPSEHCQSYLEIGVNEGLSLKAVLHSIKARSRETSVTDWRLNEIILADMWGNTFGGTGRGSHEHINQILESMNLDRRSVTFLDGDSKLTVPNHLQRRNTKNKDIDIVYVDGDHSFAGAKADLENVLPYVGKMLFFDDMYHPAHALNDRLISLHRSLVGELRDRFYVFTNRTWFGFSAFIKKDLFDSPDWK